MEINEKRNYIWYEGEEEEEHCAISYLAMSYF